MQFYRLFFTVIAFSLPAVHLEAQVRVGEIAQVVVDTPHPYPNGSVERPAVWTTTLRRSGATFMKVHFSRFAINGALENGAPQGDYVVLKDGDGVEYDVLSGFTTSDFWARSIPGDTIIIELHADAQDNADGFALDRYGYGTVALYPETSSFPRAESICEDDEKRPVCAAITPARIRLSDPVASLLTVDDCGGILFCSGFLFTPDGQLLTAAHCGNSAAESRSMEVWFNYTDNTTNAGPCSLSQHPTPDIFRAKQLLVADCDLDMAVHLVDDPRKGNPVDRYGYLPVSARAPTAHESVWVPQHPLGLEKALSEVNAAVASPSLKGLNFCADPPTSCGRPGSMTNALNDFGHTADTEGGSSGSPVLDVANQVIGLHHAGGCVGATGENSAVKTLDILNALAPRFEVKRLVLNFPAGKLTLAGQAQLVGRRLDPAADGVRLTLRDATGDILAREIPGRLFKKNRQGTQWLFIDSSGVRANGLTKLRFLSKNGRDFTINLIGKGLDLSGADQSTLNVEFIVGDSVLQATSPLCVDKPRQKVCR